jgi:hypothetical protein
MIPSRRCTEQRTTVEFAISIHFALKNRFRVRLVAVSSDQSSLAHVFCISGRRAGTVTAKVTVDTTNPACKVGFGLVGSRRGTGFASRLSVLTPAVMRAPYIHCTVWRTSSSVHLAFARYAIRLGTTTSPSGNKYRWCW